MITLRSVALVVTAVFTFLLARLTQVGWLYLLDATLWGAIILSLVLPSLSVMSLGARRKLARAVGTKGVPGPSEGDKASIELALENRSSWPPYLLTASYQCPQAPPEERLHRFFVPGLGRRSAAELAAEVQCHRRGLHHFGPVTVESKAPFGLFRRRVRLEAPLSVLVYPQIYPLRRLPLLEGAQGTVARPQRTRGGQEVAGSRHYYPGDPLKHIHWRNSARVGRPMAKELEDSQENVLVIAFDSSRDEGEGRDTVVEYSIKVAASVAAYVVRNGGGVRLLTGRLVGSEAPLPALLKELALLDVGQGPSLPGLLESLPMGSRVLAIASDGDLPGIEALAHRAGHMSALAAVVMEGFGEDHRDIPGRAVDRLRRAGVPAMSCGRGALDGAMSALEGIKWSSQTPGVRGPSPTELTERRA